MAEQLLQGHRAWSNTGPHVALRTSLMLSDILFLYL